MDSKNEGLFYFHGDDGDAETNAESVAGSRSSQKVAGLTFKSVAGRGAWLPVGSWCVTPTPSHPASSFLPRREPPVSPLRMGSSPSQVSFHGFRTLSLECKNISASLALAMHSFYVRTSILIWYKVNWNWVGTYRLGERVVLERGVVTNCFQCWIRVPLLFGRLAIREPRATETEMFDYPSSFIETEFEQLNEQLLKTHENVPSRISDAHAT